MKFPRLLPACLLFLSVFLLGEPAPAQQTLGVVTALKGQAQLTRAAARSRLRFKDSLVLRDIIDTREKSLVRILFGGKSTVTVRELSRLEIREETLPGGATHSIHELSSGGVLVKVAHELMRPGDEVQIRTPNAVAAVRGTTIFAFFDPILKRSQFACLTGVCSVTPLGLPTLTLTPKLTIAVTGDPATGVQAGTVQSMGAGQSTQIQQQFDTGPAVTQEANRQRAAQAQLRVASRLADAVLTRVGGPGNHPTTPAATTSAADGTPAKAPVIAGGTGEAISQSSRTPPEIILAGVNITLAPFETLKTFDQSGTFDQTPFILVNGSTVTQTPLDNLIQIDPGVTATLTGQLLDANNSTLSAGANFLSVQGSLTSLAGNGLLGFNTSTASAGASLVNVVGGSLTVSGPLFSANQSNLTPVDSLLFAGGGATVTGNGTSPFISITNMSAVANVTSNPLIDLGSASLTLAGPLFRMENKSTVTAASDFLKLDGATLASTSGAPLLQFAGRTADIGGSLFLASALSPSQIDVAGTVLKSENSDLNVQLDLFNIRKAQLQTSSDQPIALVEGGNLSVGPSPFALFNVSGINIDSMGLGTDQPIKGSSTPFPGASNPIGGLFKATNSLGMGATIDVVGNAIRFDTVLFEATQPLIELIGGAATGMQSKMTTGLATEEFSASKIVALGPITSLDRSLITVTDGPFLSLTDGTNMTVTGNLLRLMNGSSITVLKGPLIYVDGFSSKGLPSTLDVSGALVNFVGSGNKIVVTNSITPNPALAGGGIPVSGSNITIGANPITTPAGGSGSILINGVAVGSVGTTFTGSLIQTTNGGVVNITAP